MDFQQHQEELRSIQRGLDKFFCNLSVIVGKTTASAILSSAVRHTNRRYPSTDQLIVTPDQVDVVPLVAALQGAVANQWLYELVIRLQAVLARVEYILGKLTGRIILTILAEPLHEIHVCLLTILEEKDCNRH